jgi:hypothetical protein
MAVPIYVDYDETVTTGEGQPWWNNPLDETPREEMIELVNNLYKQGHTIIIYTARREEVREETKYYLNQWGVMHHALVMGKPGYKMLIDDRAVSDEKALELGAEGIRGRIYD